MNNIFKSLKKYKIYEYYYVIILFIVLIQLFFIPAIRLGVVTAGIILMVIYKSINKHDLLRNTSINKLVLAYLFYNTISIVWFVFSGIPVSVFFAEWANSILPVFFFYLASKEKIANFRFYNITLLVLVISFIVGFYLWVNESEIYKVFMETTEGPGTGIDFFQSLYGLTATGAFGVVGFLISSSLVLNSNGRQGKIAMIICLIATILTFRRGAMVSLFIVIIVFHYIGFLRFRFFKKRYFIIETLFIYGVYKFFLSDFNDLFENIVERSSMISEAFDKRSFAWAYAFQDLTFIFGKGVGSIGHKAIGFSKILIADGNYFKMIAEIGILGTLIFSAIIISSLVNGYKDLKNKYIDLGIVLSMCLIGVGSNIFTFQSIAPIFWYSIGRLANKNIVKRSFDNRIYVPAEISKSSVSQFKNINSKVSE